ncbi:MAG: succinate--CoA ligase subunit alpha [Candidatus Promineifilaceae bacterium]
MSILLNKDSRIVVQGITGREGSFHTNLMMEYGTNVVAGMVPKRGGQMFNDSVPIFNSVAESVAAVEPNVAMVIVPPRFAADAIIESAEAGIPFIVCLTEYIPVRDMMRVRSITDSLGVRFLGPNCPGLITPGEAKVGFISGDIVSPGNVGVVSKSGTLTYEVVYALTHAGIGQSTCVGIGGDPINGTDFIDVLKLFQADEQTERIVLMGEIGGAAEEQAAAYIKEHITKPVYAFIAGRTAPPGRTMGHAGAIVEGNVGTAAGKIAALRDAGVQVADHPDQLAQMVIGG